MIKPLGCRNAQSTILSNQVVSCCNATMNQAQCLRARMNGPSPGCLTKAEGKGRFSSNDPSPYAGRPHRDAQPTPRLNPPPRPGPSSPPVAHVALLVLTQAFVQHAV